jgi:hypothetical protein
MLRLIGGEPLVRGGQHIGKILAPDRDRRRGEHAQQQVRRGSGGRGGQRP